MNVGDLKVEWNNLIVIEGFRFMVGGNFLVFIENKKERR